MKNCFIISLLLISVNIIAQKPFYNEMKDAFTRERRLTYGNISLDPVMQVGGMIRITDSSKSFELYIVFAMNFPKIQSVDSIKKESKIKIGDGSVFTGKWLNNSTFFYDGQSYISYTYEFTEADFKIISSSNVTDIKVNNMALSIAPKKQTVIPRICKTLIEKL